MTGGVSAEKAQSASGRLARHTKCRASGQAWRKPPPLKRASRWPGSSGDSWKLGHCGSDSSAADEANACVGAHKCFHNQKDDGEARGMRLRRPSPPAVPPPPGCIACHANYKMKNSPPRTNPRRTRGRSVVPSIYPPPSSQQQNFAYFRIQILTPPAARFA
jgi:hypothetical protein